MIPAMNLLLELTKDLKGLSEKRFLLAVSGGLDSMALLEVFCHFKKNYGFDVSVAHVHHGPASDWEQSRFRLNALTHVQAICHQKGFPFYNNFDFENEESWLKSFEKPMKNEADCREYRYACLNEWMEQNQFDLLVLAHHWDDLLETRLLRLIRGVGPESLGSMQFQQGKKLRPLLRWNREELKEFVNERSVTWLEDPSNQSHQTMRNWLRNQWLPSLEARQAGALKSLGRSLDRIVEAYKLGQQSLELGPILDQDSLILSEYWTQNLESKRQAIATYMKGQGLKNYGLSHISEIIKRLDTDQKSHSFKLLGCVWNVDAGRMRVQRPGQFETSSGE